MISYFFTNSQCGCAPSCKTGIAPSSKILGFPLAFSLEQYQLEDWVTYIIFLKVQRNYIHFSANFLLSLLKLFFSLSIAAFDFSHQFSMSLDNLLDSDKILSNSA
jgi:hypothetical protein